MMAASKHLQANKIEGDEKDDTGITLGKHEDLVGMNIHLKDSDVMFFGAYARNGSIRTKLEYLQRKTKRGTKHFVLALDANQPPEEMQDKLDDFDLKAVVIQAEGKPKTCLFTEF